MKLNFQIESIIKTSGMALIGLIITTFSLMTAAAANSAEYEIVIETHRFIPDRIEMKAGEKHRLIVHNNDATPEEFESYELNREKIITGHSKAVIFLPPLEAGTYPFFGEFNEETAQGRIVVK